MLPCPDDDRFRHLLAGELAPPEVAVIDDHLRLCRACTETLKRLAGPVPSRWSRGFHESGPSFPSARVADFLASLKASPPLRLAAGE